MAPLLLSLPDAVQSAFVMAFLDAEARAALRAACRSLARLDPAPGTTAVLFLGSPGPYLRAGGRAPSCAAEPPVPGWWRERVRAVRVVDVPCAYGGDGPVPFAATPGGVVLPRFGGWDWLGMLFPAATRVVASSAAPLPTPPPGVTLTVVAWPGTSGQQRPVRWRAAGPAARDDERAVTGDVPPPRCAEVQTAHQAALELARPRVDDLCVFCQPTTLLCVGVLLAALDRRVARGAPPLRLAVRCHARGFPAVLRHPAVRLRFAALSVTGVDTEAVAELVRALEALADPRTPHRLVGLEVRLPPGPGNVCAFNRAHGRRVLAVAARHPQLRYLAVVDADDAWSPTANYVSRWR